MINNYFFKNIKLFICSIFLLQLHATYYAQQTILINQGGTVAVNNGDLFYDAGGAAGNDAVGTYTITLSPAVPGQDVCLNFTSFDTYFNFSPGVTKSATAGDSLAIYDGTTASYANSLATLMGNWGTATSLSGANVGIGTGSGLGAVLTPGIFCSTTGSLTLIYNGKKGAQPGWAATVVTYEPLGAPGCNITLTASSTSVCSPGTAIKLSSTGSIVTSALNVNFDNQSLGTGWQGSPSVSFENSICASNPGSSDGSYYLWMENFTCPRTLTTASMNVSKGGTVSFQYRQADNNGDASPCEAPDVNFSGTTPEAVFLQYSTNGTTWTTMKVMPPSDLWGSGNDDYPGIGWQTKLWKTIVVPIPAAAQTATTEFRWIQPLCTSASTDNWGLDNVVISSPSTYTISITNQTTSAIISTAATSVSLDTITVYPTTATTYQATVTDGTNSCSSTAAITIGGPTVTLSSVNATCGSLNGSVNATVTGGSGSYTYKWSNSTTSQNLSNVGANTYTVTVSDGGSCTVTKTATITNTGAPTMAAITPAALNLTCASPTGMISETATGGTGTITYAWTGPAGGVTSGAATNTATVNAAGTYTVTASASGCTATTTVAVTANLTPPTVSTVTPATLTCAAPTAILTETAVAGQTYAWNGPAGGVTVGGNTNAPTVGTAGTYTVTATSAANGCTAATTVIVASAKASPTISLPTVTQPTCGMANGSFSMTGAATTAPYTFSVNGGAFSATNTATALPAGIYTIEVQDANGCTSSTTQTLTSSGAPTMGAINPAALVLTCTNTSGTLSETATGGTGTITYAWTGPAGGITSGAATNTATVNAAGTYTVTASASGCTATTTVAVTTNLTPPTVSTVTPAAPVLTCATTSVNITEGAVAGQTYAWTGPAGGITSGAATNAATVNAAGTYTVTATSAANGCTATTTVIVSSNVNPPTITISGVTNPTCGTSNGAFSMAGSGTTPPYTYAVNAGALSANTTASALAAGIYTIEVQDANGCTATTTETLNATGGPTMAPVNPAALVLTCATTSGSLSEVATGGTGTITYAWTGPGIVGSTTASSVTVNAAGTYTVTATASGCPNTTTVAVGTNVTQPTLSTTPTAANCAGSGGSALVTVTNATDTYSYLWSDAAGQTTATATALVPGTYTVTVTDNVNGCTSKATAIVTKGPVPFNVNASATATDCAGNSGTVTATLGGVVTPSYAWAGNGAAGQTTATVTNLGIGNYTVTVTDQTTGCSSTAATAVVQTPIAFALTTASTLSNCTQFGNVGTGTASVTITGTATAPAYLWSDSAAQTTATAVNLPSGSYTVTVTDQATLCATSTVVTVPMAPPAVVSAGNNVTILLGKQVTLTATGGVLYAWSTGSLFDTTIVQPTATTQYCVLASDTNWCLDSACVTVNVETPCGQYYLPNAFSPNGDGFNDYFLVRTNIDCVVKMDLSVFDRWGEKVADLTNPTAQWDGSFRGKPLEQAVFIYYLTIEFTDGSKVAKTGNVTLVR